MPAVSNRWLLTFGGVAAYVAVALLFSPDAAAQRKDAKGEEKLVAAAQGKDWTKVEPRRLYYGVAACSNPGCHGGSPPKEWLDGKDLLCRCTESKLWLENDKHADAYKALKGPRGQQMAKILGYDVTKDARCLSCHAVVIEDKDLLSRSQKTGRFNIEEGVNCVACHGAAIDWVTAHSSILEAGDWRPLSRELKEKHGGMKDLWNPIKRAELCASCHIGSLKHDPKNGDYVKFVTHDMYAAGHPPLPGFEAAMFSEEMPRHWEYLREKKSKQVQKELGFEQGELEQTRLMLVGAAVALRESMALLVQQAKSAQAATDDDAKVLDYVNFDCYACHHDLKANSWRQRRGYTGTPGRVPMMPWPTELVRLGITQAFPKTATTELANFDAAVKRLKLAFTAKPFGDPKAIEAEATKLKTWADGLAKKLNVPINAAGVRALVARMPHLYIKPNPDKPDGKKANLDYDSARQVGWAFDVMYNELHGDPYQRRGLPEPKGKATGDPDVRKAQMALSDYLKLRLPIGRKEYFKEGKTIEDELQRSLQKRNDYDPARFQRLLIDATKSKGK